MPPNDLPLTGVRAIVEDMRKFLNDQDTIEKRVKKTSKAIEDSTKKGKGFGSILDAAGKDLSKFVDRLVQGIPGGQAFAGVLETVTGSLGSLSLAAVGAIAIIGALVVAFFALGARGAATKGLAESFDIQVRRIGISSAQLLEDLDAAASGTVSRLDLIRSSNLALAGAVGEFGRQFGQALPKILEIARVQARATGQSVDYLFNSLVTGIKRSSPLLIDNTGLVLKVGEANEAYAASIGKTVEQLTAEERQIALLQATLEAGTRATEALGGAQEGASEKIARAQATISNILDTLALSIQPLYESILDVVNGILGGIQRGVNSIAPYIQVIATLLGGLIDRVVQVANTIMSILGPASPLGDGLFRGALRMFGAFANAIIQVANQLIFPAVIGIARFIADFLIGESPPPKGPLSDIDKGGAATMEAWLAGLTGIALDPVEDVANFVADALGSIGGLSRTQLVTKLKALDEALKPFEQRLTIIKARFEELQAPAQAALNAIDRQSGELLEKVLLGDVEAADKLRTLEAQREIIQGQVDAQQQLVDQAEIQFALAKSQQARERSLLQLRLDQLGAQKKVKREAEKAAGKLPKEKELKGAAEAITEEGVPSFTPVGEADASSPLDLLAGEEAGQTFDELMAEFSGQIQPGSLDLFDTNIAELQTQVGRIKGANIGERLFGGLGDSIGALFDPANPTSIPALISNIDLSAAVSAASTALQPLADLFNPEVDGSPMNTLKGMVESLIDPENPTSIPFLLGSIGGQIVSQLDRAKVSVAYFIDSIFNKDREGSPAYILYDFIDSITDPEREGSVPYTLGQIGENIRTTVTDIGEVIEDTIITPISRFLVGTGEGSLGSILNIAIEFFRNLGPSIVTALRSFGALVWGAIVVPIIRVIDGIIEAVETGLKSLVESVIQALTPIIDGLTGLGIDPGLFTGLKSSLESARDSIQFARLGSTIQMPSFLQDAGGGGVDNSTTINATFNGVQGAQDATRRFAGMRASI